MIWIVYKVIGHDFNNHDIDFLIIISYSQVITW